MLEHGGNLRAAARHYGLPLARWLDLSTGINPRGYRPPEAIPGVSWLRLPEEEDGLLEAASHYYGVGDLLPIPGSQAAIQGLPRLFAPGRVGVLAPTYGEHARSWKQAGHEVILFPATALLSVVEEVDRVVLVNPNNPTGQFFDRDLLASLALRLFARGGELVVDEAFMDATPSASLLTLAERPGVVVLRSLGKFFGLAGARVGFLAAPWALREALRELLGPWTLTGPSRWVAAAALRDGEWQEATRHRLAEEGARLAALLRQGGLPPAGGCALFQWLPTPAARIIQRRLAERAIWIRAFDDPAGIRFGLPGDPEAWQKLTEGLRDILSDTLLAAGERLLIPPD